MFYRFSGITEEDLEDVTTSIRDVQAVLLSLFTDRTILLGHSLESDLNALKVSAGLEVIKLFSCSTQLSMKFIMLIQCLTRDRGAAGSSLTGDCVVVVEQDTFILA